MSMNTATTPDGRGVLLYSGEMILIYIKQVQMSFSGPTEPEMNGKKDGALYLTSHRIIFTSERNDRPFKSFAMPLYMIQDVKLEQPLLGANYLKGFVQALPGGNFTGEVRWKLSFPKGGCIDFGRALLGAVERVSGYRSTTAPPSYEGYSAPVYHAAPTNYYVAPQAYAATFPTMTAFQERPQGNLYVHDQPPPYPGVGPLPSYEQSNNQYPAPAYVPFYSAPPAAAPSGSAPPYSYAEAPPLPQKN